MSIRSVPRPLPLVVFLVVLGLAVANTAWKPSQIPSPQNDVGGVCGRNGVKSAVCDPDGILSVSDRDSIDGLINFIAEGTNGYEVAQCGQRYEGYQFAVLIIDRMDHSYHRFMEKASRAEHFAKDIHDAWGVGDAECQNGVVLFISVEDRQMHVSTGAGVKGILTDSGVQHVLSLMKPYMREEQYGRAIFACVRRMGKVLSGQVPADPEVSAGDGGFFAVVVFIMMASCCCQGLSSNRKRRKYDRCKAVLRRIDNDTDAAKKGVYKATSCPICLEEFDSNSKPTAYKSGDEGKENEDIESAAKDGEAVLPLLSEERPKDAKEENVRVALPCGHQFHSACIREWMSSDASRNRFQCPVCRKPITGEPPAEERECGMDEFEEERSFRIYRAHDLYPDYITYSMANRYNREHELRMADQRNFIDLDPRNVEAARNAGNNGSTFSFGGGSSFGGGGGGSSW